jgi:NO-binding membrane sensor protein with MHYT domain/nitrogen-specific signal transduction histidine kinase
MGLLYQGVINFVDIRAIGRQEQMNLAGYFTIGLDTAQAMPATFRPSLVVLSYLIASFGAFTFLRFAGRLSEMRSLRGLWLIAGSVTMGVGIWSMHFIGMLAHDLPVPVSYDPLITAASAVPAVLAAAIALHLISRPALTTGRLLLGGVLMGAGIGVMHYTGMAAMRLDGIVRYEPTLFAASIVVAVALAIVALKVRFWVIRDNGEGTVWQEIGAALILGFAVTAMHYTAMASTYCFAGARTSQQGNLDPHVFGTVTTIITVLLILLALAIVIFDRKVRQEIALRQEAADRVLSTSQQLAQSQKMEVVGQLTGGIAHDFNNLLAVISMKMEGLIDELPPDSPHLPKINAALAAAERGGALVARMMAFSRRRPQDAVRTDIAGLLSEFKDLLATAVPRTVKLSVEIEPGLRESVIDRTGLETAILNLVVNARDAMPSGGKLRVGACNRGLRAGDPVLPPDMRPGDWVVVTVADTGSGMSPEIQAKVFEPFFTTKPVGKGTGLGMAMVRDFVRHANGFVTLESESGRGTTVSLYLPAAPVVVAATRAATAPQVASPTLTPSLRSS